jgi:hypothetical protein
MTPIASSAVSTNRNSVRSSSEISPDSASIRQSTTFSQNPRPNSRNGTFFIRPVWISVRLSNISSIVPKPPGNTATARARIRKCIFRIAK